MNRDGPDRSPADPALRLEVLGPPRARRGERTLPLCDRRPDEVLAVVVASPRAEASAGALLEHVWDRLADRRGLDVLKNAVYQLNRRFDDELGIRPLVASARGYRLAPDIIVDAAAFELEADRLERCFVAQAQQQAVLEDLHRRAEAARMQWRGNHAFAGLDRTTLVADRARLLNRQRLMVSRVGLECAVALGHFGPAVPGLRTALDDEPFDESLCGLLMTALARSGRQREALTAYADFNRNLLEHTGLRPSIGLQELEQRLLTDDRALAWQPPPLGPPDDARPAPSRPGPVDVSALSPRARLTLKTAAVGGSPFALDQVAAVIGHDPDAVSSWLDEAVAAGVVVEADHQRGHYRFADEQIRRQVGEAIGSTHRARLHRRWATAAAEHRPFDAGRRARHLLQAEPPATERELVGAVAAAVEESARCFQPATATELLAAALDPAQNQHRSPATRHRLAELALDVQRWRAATDPDAIDPDAVDPDAIDPDATKTPTTGPAPDPTAAGPKTGPAAGPAAASPLVAVRVDEDPLGTVQAPMTEGRFDAALARAVQLEDQAGGTGAEVWRWWSLVARSAMARVHGSFPSADRLAAEAHRIGSRLDDPAAAATADTIYALQLHDSLWWAGSVGTMTEALATAAVDGPPLAKLLLSQALLTNERGDEAARIWASCRSSLALVPPTSEGWLPTMVLAADLVTTGIDDGDEAQRLWDRLLPHAGRWVCVGRVAACWGPVDGYLAALALTLGRRTDADDALTRAETQCSRASAPLWGDRLWPLFNRLAA